MAVSDSLSLVDIHNHLVPGVDDGARDLAAVLASVERMTQHGIRRIITTPHLAGSLSLDPERLQARLDVVTRAWEEAAEAIGQSFPEVEYRRGHEVLLDVPNVDLSDERMRMAGTSFVLVEWPRLQLPPGTVPVVKRLVGQGYRPIVAHPERYHGMGASLQVAQQWREAGAYLQVNYGSIAGRFGSEAQRTAYRLLRRGWADYLASDFHGHAQLKVYKAEVWQALEEVGGEEALTYLCRTNPGRILSDELPLAVAPLPAERGFWARLKDMIQGSTV
jgi:protein-tyrosine phosphatase